MDERQYNLILSAVTLSSQPQLPATPTEHSQSFTLLEQFKTSNSSATASFLLLERTQHIYKSRDVTIDVTAQVKLYSLLCLQIYSQQQYSQLVGDDRLNFRNKILSVITTINEDDNNVVNIQQILAQRLASILCDILLRDFPQKWAAFFEDLMKLFKAGSTPTQIAFICITLAVEDCTDSDFNSKITASRRTDILQGLNEIASKFLPATFEFLNHHYTTLLAVKAVNNEHAIKRHAKLLSTGLNMLKVFSIWMPLEWSNNPNYDFVAVYFHLLRENTNNINLLAASCLDSLTARRLPAEMFERFLHRLPSAIADANSVVNTDTLELLVEQLEFHVKLSEALSHLVSLNVAKITDDKTIVSADNASQSQSPSPSKQAFLTYLNLMVEMTSHPSPTIALTQMNTWVVLCRDPQIGKSGLLRPFVSPLLTNLFKACTKLSWSDVENGDHPLSVVYDAIWSEQEEYEFFTSECRAKTGMLIKHLAGVEPEITTKWLKETLSQAITVYGSPQADVRIDSMSPSDVNFEVLTLPFENVFSGVTKFTPEVVANLQFMANAIITWNPTSPKHVLLIYRRACFLESLKHFWVHDPRSLPSGIDALLNYLSFRDETCQTGPITSSDQLLLESIQVRRKAGIILVSVVKLVSNHLAQYVNQLTDRAKQALGSDTLLPAGKMHLFEFLTCVANAMPDSEARSEFIQNVLTESMTVVEGVEMKELFTSTDSLLSGLGVVQAAGGNVDFVTNPGNVERISGVISRVFTSLNQLASVGKRCEEASKARVHSMMVVSALSIAIDHNSTNQQIVQAFPDENSTPLSTLANSDPFVSLWPRILSGTIQCLRTTLSLWTPLVRSKLLKDKFQRYVLAISDEEAVSATKKFFPGTNPMDQVAETGYVITGADRRKCNLVPKWQGWLNEMRTGPFQILGLCAAQKALFSPEVAPMFSNVITALVEESSLWAMEHRHLVQLIKQFVEPFMMNCPCTLYEMYLSPILAPLFAHIQRRLAATWKVLDGGKIGIIAPASGTAEAAASDCESGNGSVEWFERYYLYGGLFVGDLETTDNETVVEKIRIELTHAYADLIQTVLALKGEWALTLANIAKEVESNLKKSKVNQGQIPKGGSSGSDKSQVNADGTAKSEFYTAIEQRQVLRIDRMATYLLVSDESVAGPIVMSMIAGMNYPDAHTSRRCTKVCHRIIENCAHIEKYSQVLGQHMFSVLVQQIIHEPRWMVGMQWEAIALIRDIYCRLVLGQALLSGGQGPGLQCAFEGGRYAQHKGAAKPRDGGGILCFPSDLPRQVLADLPGITHKDVLAMEESMKNKRSAKDQKAFFKDLLSIAAEKLKKQEAAGSGEGKGVGVFARVTDEESVWGESALEKAIQPIPERGGVSTKKKKAKAMAAKKVNLDGGLGDDLNGLFSGAGGIDDDL